MDSGKEIKPLKTLEEVLTWKPSEPAFSYPGSSKRSKYYLPGGGWSEDGDWSSLVKTPLTREPGVKTLVCHDMMGGYLQDRFLDGVNEDGYIFRHWSNIDIFVYFSHHFLTIPPPGWISAARVHGVTVLGTIITEWDQGQQMLETILHDEDKTDQFVDVCVRLCRHYGFHGWLFNIENKVSKDLIPKLINLVQSVTAAIKQELGEDEGMVLWYDSVTIEDPDGNVTPDSLAHSVSALLLTSDDTHDTNIADTRHPATIFVGVDVFGRGCLGGGGFQCNQALSEIRKRGMSVAIFAPGRVSDLSGQDGSLVFRTCFSLGRQSSPQPAYNLTRTQHQPSLVVFNEGENNDQSVLGDLQETTLQQPAYSCFTCDDSSLVEGQSLKIKSKVPDQTIPIFIMELPINSEKSFLFVLTVKTENNSGLIQLKFGTEECREIVAKSLSSSELAMVAKQNNLALSEASSKDCCWRNMAFILPANGTDHKTIHKIGMKIENPATIFIGKFEIYKIVEKK